MRKLLFLGGPVFQIPMIEKAKAMGLRVGIVDRDEEAAARPYADDFFRASLLDQEAVFSVVENYRPDGVICGACDTSVQTAAAVCERFNLPGNTMAMAKCATDKLLMLKAFERGGVPHPAFQFIPRDAVVTALPTLPYPLISKPVDSSGSRGINLITCLEEYPAKATESSRAGRSGDILLEEYLDGNEISVEVVVLRGEPHVLQVTDKITTGAPHFCEIGHSQPALLSEALRQEVEAVAKGACRAVGLQNSPAHIEMKLTKNGPKMVEMGARMAGDTISTYLIDTSLQGADMAESAIRIALGEDFELSAYRNSEVWSAVRMIGSRKGTLTAMSGVETARAVPGVVNVTLMGKVGRHYEAARSNTDRVGFVVARGNSKDEALHRCDEAIACLKFEWNADS